MPTSKVAITIESGLLKELDRLIAKRVFRCALSRLSGLVASLEE